MGTKINLYKQSGTDDGTSVNFNVPRSLTYGLNARANDDGGVSESDNCTYNTLNDLVPILNSASLVVTPSSYKEGKLYSVIPSDGSGDMSVVRATSATRVNAEGLIETASILGSELVVNGDFATDTNWTKGTGWTISGGIATLDGTQVGGSSLSSTNMSVTVGKTYKVTVNVSATSSGFRLYDTLGVVSYGLVLGENVHYRTVASSTYTILPLGLAGATGSIDNVSVKEVITNNIPRLDYSLGGCPNILLEPQRTNLVLQSEDISSASWTKGNTPAITSNIAIAPDGTMSADGIQSLTGGVFRNISQNFTVASNSTVTGSVFVKKETSETFYGGFSILFQGGTTKILYVIVDAVNGTGTVSGSTLTGTIKVEDYDNYWRISATTTDNGSNTACRFTYEATLSTNGTTLNAAAGSVRTIWGFQTELGNYSTSYIPTTTASVTRNADFALISNASNLIGQTEGTMFIEFTRENNSVGTFSISANNVGTRIYIGTDATGLICQVRNGYVEQAYFSTAQIEGTKYKCAIAYATNDFVLYMNGTQIGTDTSGTVPACNTIKTNNGGGLNLNQPLNQALLFKTRLTNAELATLTTI